MKKMLQTLGLVMALGQATAGCSPTKVSAAPAPEPAATTAATAPTAPARPITTEAKTGVPVKLTLAASAQSGTVVVTLTVQALADLPRAVTRIMIPQGAQLVKGDREVDFGAVPSGAVRTHQLTLEVPATTQVQLFAGVDCRMSVGILQHKEAVPLLLGQPSGNPAAPTSP